MLVLYIYTQRKLFWIYPGNDDYGINQLTVFESVKNKGTKNGQQQKKKPANAGLPI